jgi:ligand-binding sensor domain-containing protein
MLKFVVIFFCTLILQLISGSILANTLQKTYNVINFTTSKIRDQQDVKAITQDSHGFIWFASNSGLFRFDGLNLKKYSLQTHNSTHSPKVKSLLIDSNNILWVGTNDSLLTFDRTSETFQHVKLKSGSYSFAILNLLEDKQNDIWVGTRGNGLFKIKQTPTKNTISHFHKTAKGPFKISNNQIRSLYQTTDDKLWIGTKNGLSSYSFTHKRITHHKVNIPSHPKKKLTVYSILELKKHLLLGSDVGLISFNKNTSTGSLYSSDKLLASSIYSVKYSHNQDLIIGSKRNGLMIIDPKTKTIIKLNKSKNKNSKLNSNMVYTSFSDNTGNIWLGTRVGINKLTYTDSSIDLYRAKDNSSQCLASSENHAIFLDSQNNLWLGAKGQGLNFIDRTNNSCKLFNRNNINLPNITFQLIIDIKEDFNGNIWIASFNEGLIKYNPKTEKFSQLSFADVEKNQIVQRGKIMDIFIDKNNHIWLGVTNYGLVRYDQKNHVLELLGKNIAKNLQHKKLSVKNIEHINNTLWLGTAFSGLISYNIETGQFKSFLSENENLNIVTTALDNHQNIWVGTRDNGIQI